MMVASGFAQAPHFTSPPVVATTDAGAEITFATDRPAIVHWAVIYSDVSAAYRYHLLGFESSQLSSNQVRELAMHGLSGSSLRSLQEASDETSSAGSGPVIAWGSEHIAEANDLSQSVNVDTESAPCLTMGMCRLSVSAVNPVTEYKV